MEYRFNKEVSITMDNATVYGDFIVPPGARPIVIFSHGSGSSRVSIRNQMVANYLHISNIGSMLFDLLTEEEDITYSNRFNIDLLTKRLAGANSWLEEYAAAKDCCIGYFGAGTGAASALKERFD